MCCLRRGVFQHVILGGDGGPAGCTSGQWLLSLVCLPSFSFLSLLSCYLDTNKHTCQGKGCDTYYESGLPDTVMEIPECTKKFKLNCVERTRVMMSVGIGDRFMTVI